MLRYVACAYTGEPIGEIPAIGAKTLALQLNGVHQATVTARLTDPLAPSLLPGLAPRLKVYRTRSASELAADPTLQPELVFYGSLPAENVQADAAADALTLTFSDPRWVLARRYSAPTVGSDTYAATDQGSILWGLVNTQNARTGGDTWIRQGGVTTGTTRDRTYDRRSVLELFDEMTKVLDGPDVDVDPRDGWTEAGNRVMANLRVYGRQGSDLSGTVAFAYGEGLASNVLAAQVSYLPQTTYATFTGTQGDAAAPLSASYGTPSEVPFGLLEQYQSDPDVSTSATLAAKATGAVLEGQGLRAVVTVAQPTSEAPQPWEHYYLGDTVRAVIRKGAIELDQQVRVAGFTVTTQTDGREDTGLTLFQP